MDDKTAMAVIVNRDNPLLKQVMSISMDGNSPPFSGNHENHKPRYLVSTIFTIIVQILKGSSQ